jgi:hypothetical protein
VRARKAEEVGAVSLVAPRTPPSPDPTPPQALQRLSCLHHDLMCTEELSQGFGFLDEGLRRYTSPGIFRIKELSDCGQ